MRLACLFLKSRRAGWSLAYLVGIVAAIASLRVLIAVTGPQDRDPFTEGSLLPMLLVFLPMASALVIGVGAHGPFGEAERTVSRPLPPLRVWRGNSSPPQILRYVQNDNVFAERRTNQGRCIVALRSPCHCSAYGTG